MITTSDIISTKDCLIFSLPDGSSRVIQFNRAHIVAINIGLSYPFKGKIYDRTCNVQIITTAKSSRLITGYGSELVDNGSHIYSVDVAFMSNSLAGDDPEKQGKTFNALRDKLFHIESTPVTPHHTPTGDLLSIEAEAPL